MSVLCALGWHRPNPLARWNQGYYFSSCRGCGRDLVRTAFEAWHVPRDHRVVWSATPPKSLPTAALVPELEDRSPPADHAGGALPCDPVECKGADHAPETPAAAHPEASAITVPPRASDGETEQSGPPPITEVLELLREEELRQPAEIDASAEDEEAVDPVAGPPDPGQTFKAKEPAGGASDDFMAEPADLSPGSIFWEAADIEDVAVPAGQDATPQQERDSSPNEETVEQADAGRPAEQVAADDVAAEEPAPAQPIPPALELPDAQVLPSVALDKAPERLEQAMPRRRKADWPSAAPTQVRTPIVGINELPTDRRRIALRIGAAALLVAVMVVLASRGIGSNSERALTGSSGQTIIIPPGSTPAFVVARLLNCRASPVLRAASVRILPRGEAVWVIAREPGWLSIAHQGRQCWVAERYVSAEAPV